MQGHLFLTAEEFLEEYRKQALLVANLTNIFFEPALALLAAKVDTFTFL